ncbi:hypothetical protein GOBAR_AA33149 [Gossypium barbadense]|uniref:Uncharacterized protein n=1 Tax=Gossypium barbadense TaxID=3634 RepID=A0A2P5W923_GOSBA|nr:hypothetical protein GOBAR_AA33149 [Gossypium barbadense]
MCYRPFSISCPLGYVVDHNRALCPECAPLNLCGLVGAIKKLVVGLRGGSASLPHGEHRSARPYCWRCAPGFNWLGRSSGADFDPIVLAFEIGEMINRDSRGHSISCQRLAEASGLKARTNSFVGNRFYEKRQHAEKYLEY